MGRSSARNRRARKPRAVPWAKKREMQRRTSWIRMPRITLPVSLKEHQPLPAWAKQPRHLPQRMCHQRHRHLSLPWKKPPDTSSRSQHPCRRRSLKTWPRQQIMAPGLSRSQSRSRSRMKTPTMRQHPQRLRRRNESARTPVPPPSLRFPISPTSVSVSTTLGGKADPVLTEPDGLNSAGRPVS